LGRLSARSSQVCHWCGRCHASHCEPPALQSDGWCKGINTRTHATGFYPANYAEAV